MNWMKLEWYLISKDDISSFSKTGGVGAHSHMKKPGDAGYVA